MRSLQPRLNSMMAYVLTAACTTATTTTMPPSLYAEDSCLSSLIMLPPPSLHRARCATFEGVTQQHLLATESAAKQQLLCCEFFCPASAMSYFWQCMRAPSSGGSHLRALGFFVSWVSTARVELDNFTLCRLARLVALSALSTLFCRLLPPCTSDEPHSSSTRRSVWYINMLSLQRLPPRHQHHIAQQHAGPHYPPPWPACALVTFLPTAHLEWRYLSAQPHKSQRPYFHTGRETALVSHIRTDPTVTSHASWRHEAVIINTLSPSTVHPLPACASGAR